MATRHLFVDEAGDLTLFDKRGRPMLGREGVSTHFMVGVAEVVCPHLVTRRLSALRARMLADPYFAGAPSMHPERRKTALAFHAKDDLPEVRWRVYEQLRRCNIRYSVVVREKAALEALASRTFAATRQKLRQNDIYDDLVARLFVGQFSEADMHRVTFALPRTGNRNSALTRAVERARQIQQSAGRYTVTSMPPRESVGLQVVDYYLWATQRFFELRESRFLVGMADHVDCIWHEDAGTRGMRYEGESGILTLQKALPLASARFEEAPNTPHEADLSPTRRAVNER